MGFATARRWPPRVHGRSAGAVPAQWIERPRSPGVRLARERANRALCGTCEGHDEAQCLAERSCRAAYSVEGGSFLGCWGALRWDATSSSACAGLDAYECSRHDDCSAWYARTLSGAVRSDCRAIDSGIDCTCTAVSCSCAAQQFERCEAVASVGNLAGAAGGR